MKVGIVLATRLDLAHAAAIALAARRARHAVRIFAMDLGCTALSDDPATVLGLLDEDIEITACSNSSVGVDLPEGVIRGSQDDHAAVVGTADRVVAFT